ncbi:MAG: response regulator transcription factor [Betaproteobacteria bacterium]|nr:response regulator transcription factor [Betaproteobacteria bacterium]MDE1981305.1 response regulator transcription factor [Betaproteobacteria bacterium]MDE2132332.1 response regulator transcription factor [Betaproteobacteria bacterium]MDE2212137.1 response regulator transcription factor [Betaproteobacteria bacterium]
MSLTVFIADDHAVVREGLGALLSTQPDIHIVGTAMDGREAVTEVLRLKPRVVLLDISMPGLDGIESMRQILAQQRDTAVVILSMHSSAQHVFHAIEAGARGYLLKESAGREIIEAVRAVHAGRRFLSPKVAEIVAEGLGGRSGESPLERLSRREREIIKLVADGHSSAEIARLLNLSPKTVDSYRSRLMQKLHLSDLAGLVKFAIQHGLTALE